MEFRSCARGVSGVASFITTDERLQLNQGCCFLVQAMLPEGFPFYQFYDLYWFWVHLFKGHGHKGPFWKTMISAHYIEECLSQSYYILHTDWSWWGHGPFDFGFTRLKVKVTTVTCEKCTVSAHYLENYLLHSFHILNVNWPW